MFFFVFTASQALKFLNLDPYFHFFSFELNFNKFYQISLSFKFFAFIKMAKDKIRIRILTKKEK